MHLSFYRQPLNQALCKIYVCFNNFLAGINALYLKSYLGYYIKDLLDLMKLSHSH